MSYKKINRYPTFESNPFIEEAIKKISISTGHKREFINGTKQITNHIVNYDGEIVGHSRFVRFVQVDEEKFIKVYIKEFAAFYDLTKSAKRVFGYIIERCIIPNKDVFYIDYDEAKQVTGYLSDNVIRSGISSLIENKIIARSKSPYKYYMNPLTFFNGNRISFVKTYIKNRELR